MSALLEDSVGGSELAPPDSDGGLFEVVDGSDVACSVSLVAASDGVSLLPGWGAGVVVGGGVIGVVGDEGTVGGAGVALTGVVAAASGSVVSPGGAGLPPLLAQPAHTAQRMPR